MDVEVTCNKKTAFTCDTIVEEVRELIEEDGISQPVSSTGRRTVDTCKTKTLVVNSQRQFNDFEGSVSEREGGLDGTVRHEAIFHDDSNPTTAFSSGTKLTREREKLVARGCQVSAFTLITGLTEPGFSQEHDVNIMILHEVCDGGTLPGLADRFSVEMADRQLVGELSALQRDHSQVLEVGTGGTGGALGHFGKGKQRGRRLEIGRKAKAVLLASSADNGNWPLFPCTTTA
jgi:hypothetical protein